MGNTPSNENMGEDMSKDEFIKYQQRLISQQQEELSRLNQTQNQEQPQNQEQQTKKKIDPYKILELGKNYDENTLKKAYLKKALLTHPDRGGTEEKFKLVTICYKALLKKLNESNNNNEHHDLRQHSNTFMDTQMNHPSENIQSNHNLKKNFNSNVFNQIYEENRIENVYDEGYEEWMKKNEAQDEPQEKMFHGEFNSDTFHNVFTEMKKKNIKKSDQLTKYNEPMTTISYKNKDSLMTLGQGKIEDYSGESGGLAYRDYKDAYTNTYLVDEGSVSLSSRAKSLNETKSERTNISFEMSSNDLEMMQRKIKSDETNEKLRLQRLQQEEKQAFDVYDRLHQRMIGPS